MKLKSGFELVNEDKVERALNGTLTPSGDKVGGIAKEDGSYDENELLAEYDKMGGAIRQGTDKVETGSFYDFKKKKPREKPQVALIFRINGKVVRVVEGEETPNIVKAARILAEDKEEKPKKKK